jgi:hypothetical protein
MRLNNNKPGVIGPSAQANHKPTDNLSQIEFAGVEREPGIKANTKPTTSITGKLQRGEIKQS